MGVITTTPNMFSKICLFALLALVAARRPPRFPQDFRWSSAGPVKGWRCTQIKEGADPHTWNDNYLCTNKRAPNMRWEFAGPKGACVRWHEGADRRGTWHDNYLCRA